MQSLPQRTIFIPAQPEARCHETGYRPAPV